MRVTLSFFHHLSRRKTLLVVLALLFSAFQLSAQRQSSLNIPKYDYQKLHFGFLLGMNFSDLRVQLVPDFRISDSIFRIEAEPVVGLNLGILANLRLGNYFDLRFLPSLSFAQRNLIYDIHFSDSVKGKVTKDIESNYLEFPIDLKFKSKRINNYRIYVLAGFRYSIDMISQENVESKDKNLVKLQKFDYGYEIGLGFDFYLPYFKFSPEIKMYHGLHNMVVQDGKSYSNPIDGLFSKIFNITMCFE